MRFQEFLEYAEKKSNDELISLLCVDFKLHDSLDITTIDYIYDEIIGGVESRFSQNDFLDQFMLYLFDHGFYEKIYFLHNNINKNQFLGFRTFHYLKSLLEMGKVNEFEVTAKQTLEDLLGLKLFSLIKKFLNEFQSKLKSKDFYTLAKILYFFEISNKVSLVTELQKIRHDNIEYVQNTPLLTKVYNLLELNHIDDDEDLYREKLFFKFMVSILSDTQMILREQNEGLLFATTIHEKLLVATSLGADNCTEYLQYLKKNENLSARDFPGILKNSHVKKEYLSWFTSEVQQVEEEITPEPKIDLKIQYQEDNQIIEPESYQLSEDEKSISNFLKIADDDRFYTESMVISFFNLRYYSLAMQILGHIPESSNVLYLKAMACLSLREFSKTVENVNNCLNKYHLTDLESIPFEVLKALAFKKLGEEKEYITILDRIKAINPSFVLTEDMWQV